MPRGPEDRLTDWIREQVASRGTDLIGDDAALLPGGLAFTVDQQVADVHFPAALPPAAIGRRLAAVNLSDLAAVGAWPRHAVLAVAAPASYPLKTLIAAVEQRLAEHGATLAGGDIARAPTLSASLSLLGERPRGHRWVRRSGGEPGDRLWISGSLGESAAGRHLLAQGARLDGRSVCLPTALARHRTLHAVARRAVRRHIDPAPRLAFGHWLGTRHRAAAIDVSDGLLLDLERLCRASGVGAVIETDSLPTSARLEELAEALDLRASELVLAGGEDYELLCALPPTLRPPSEFEAVAIGELRPGRVVRIVGAPRPASAGWDHLEYG